MKHGRKKLRGLLLAVLLIPALLTGCAVSGRTESITELSQLEHGKIGVWSGSICETVAREYLPDAEYVYYNTLVDMATAVDQGKVDAFSTSEGYFAGVRDSIPELCRLGEPIGSFDTCFIVRPDERGGELLKQFNTYIAQARASGEIERINAIWRGDDEEAKVIDRSGLTGENGTVTLAVPGLNPTWNYVKDGEVVGSEIDIAVHFCAAFGYDLDVELMDFGALTPAVSACKCDMAASGFEYSDERAEEVCFTDPLFAEPLILVVRNAERAKEKLPLLQSIKESFVKTFIRENRWQMFLTGIGETLIITVLSIVLGTAAGFAVYLLCRKGSVIANSVSRFAVWLVQGMPVIVLLMIFYYVIFGNTHITGLWVSVICFTLVFAAAMIGMIQSGVGAVDRGQLEGALALGYTDRQAFFRVILPQATLHFLPAYKSEVVAHIKATAVVGYIAVQDLTKASDIVRSRTYEAFFPLIVTAIIYFILAGLLTAVVSRIQIRIDPYSRSKEKILKGLKGGEEL